MIPPKYVYYHDAKYKIYQIYEFQFNHSKHNWSYVIKYSKDRSDIGHIGYIQQGDFKEKERYSYSNNLKKMQEKFMLDIL